MIAFGADAETVESTRNALSERAAQEAPDFEVWEENMETVEVFCALATQWRYVAGLAGVLVLGINYSAIPATLRLMGVPEDRHPTIFDGLRIMESVVLKESLERKNGK